MDQNTIYLSKIYFQADYYLKTNSLRLDDEDKLEDIFISLKEYINLIERSDKGILNRLLPEELTTTELEVSYERIKEIITDIIDKINQYNEYTKSYFQNLIVKVDEKMNNLGFSGNFPKYYKNLSDEVLIVEYDDDIYFKNDIDDEIISKRMAMIVRIKNPYETLPNLDINTFTYLDLVTKYAELLQTGNIRSFMIHLPELNYQTPMTIDEVNDDLKYLEVVETILNKGKHLPKWYVNVNRSAKDFERTYMLYSLLPCIILISIIGMMIFGNSSTALLICYVIGFILNVVLCKYFGKKSYYKYHPKDRNLK